MLTVAILGPVEVRRNGRLLAVPSGKTTEVLIRLALDSGSVVGADRILDDLWADAASGVGKNTLQSKVSQLRRALADPGLVISGNGGYRLNIDPDDVDALRIVELAATATELLRSGQLEQALRTSSEGLALFRGAALVDAGDGEWLHPHRARLDLVRVSLIEDNLAARVRLGAGNDVIGRLRELVAQYPLRENLWYLLITALYQNGRQAEALSAYAQVRQTLLDELGLDPGPQLQDLERQVLQQQLTPVAVPPRGPTIPATTSSTGNLPRLSSPLIGRELDLADLTRLIDDQRLVTLVGTPGVGKTRLAIEVARATQPPGGKWLVRLDAIDSQTPLTQMLAEILNISGEQALYERVSAAETLLVFDNCEHVIDAAADLINRLLDSSDKVRILATSQLPLGVDGERVYQLEPLPVADSVRLFTSRAMQIRPRFTLDTETAEGIEQLCRSLDGVPLAIELAAARVKSLSVQEIARRLDDRFVVLRDPTSRRPERRRALAAAIGWSYDLLFPDDQRGLWALSCFAGGAPLAAAEQLLHVLEVPGAAAADVMQRLVDRSLVQVDVAAHGEVRYRLLDSIRAYSADRLRGSAFQHVVNAAHAAWYGENADFCAETVRGPGQPSCVDFVRQERANIDAALGWSAEHDPLLGIRIANGFGWTWVVLGDGVAGAGRIRAALSAAGALATDEQQLTALLLAGWLEASAGDLAVADRELELARDLAAGSGSDQWFGDVQRHQAFLRIQQGRPQEALDLAERSVEVARTLNRPWEQAAGLVLAASAAMMLGDIPGAVAAAGTGLTLLEPIGDSWGRVHGQAMLGAIAQAAGRFDEAAQHLSQAAETSHRLGFLGQEAYHLTRLGRVQQQAGRADLAAETLLRAIEAANDDGDLRMTATASINLARVLRGTDRHEDAVALLEQTDAWYRRSGGGDGALLTQVLLASIARPDGSVDGDGDLEHILAEARELSAVEVEVLALDVLGRFAAQRGDFDGAAGLLQVADAMSRQNIPTIDDLDRFDARLARTLISASR